MTPEQKREAYKNRLKELSMRMYDAMSQGGNHQIAVTPEMAEDVMSASALVEINKDVWNKAIEEAAKLVDKDTRKDQAGYEFGPAIEIRKLKK